MTIPVLQFVADPEGCRACALGRSELPRVPGVGPLDAEVAVVGINPSVRARPGVEGAFLAPFLARMQARGRPLSALSLQGSERAFAALVDEIGLDLSRCYTTNVLKCATPGNRAPVAAEWRICRERFLRFELEDLPNLRAVLAYGRLAAEATTSWTGFHQTGRVNGTIAEAIVLRHPVSVLRKWTRLEVEARAARRFLERVAPASLAFRSSE